MAACSAQPRRRDLLVATGICISAAPTPEGRAADFVTMEAIKDKDYGKTPMKFPDFDTTESGLQFKDLRAGTGAAVKEGDNCVLDWQGYTVGYYGRIFEARNKVLSLPHSALSQSLQTVQSDTSRVDSSMLFLLLSRSLLIPLTPCSPRAAPSKATTRPTCESSSAPRLSSQQSTRRSAACAWEVCGASSFPRVWAIPTRTSKTGSRRRRRSRCAPPLSTRCAGTFWKLLCSCPTASERRALGKNM